MAAAASELVPPELADARRLHSIDVFQLEYADDVQISPDGNRIVLRARQPRHHDRPRASHPLDSRRDRL
jgi:hypothetical protein